MRSIQPYELKHISGSGVLFALGTSTACLTGMAVGTVVGATLLDPTIDLIKGDQSNYLSSLKSQVIDTVITYKYGHLGIESKTDAIGAVSGALIGSVMGATLFAFIV